MDDQQALRKEGRVVTLETAERDARCLSALRSDEAMSNRLTVPVVFRTLALDNNKRDVDREE